MRRCAARRRFAARARLLVPLLLLAASAPRAYQRPSDPLFPWQWSLENRGQPVSPGAEQRGSPDADIDAVEAFAAGYTGAGVVIAVIGLGFGWRGSSVEPSLWHNPGEQPGNGIDDDGDGLVDDVIGWDFQANDPDPSSTSTHDWNVAEMAVAPHDGKRTAGVAPGAKLMILRVADERQQVLVGPLPRALVYAVERGARVILLPWTFRKVPCHEPALGPLNELIKQVGRRALVIGGEPGNWPACHPEVVSVQPTGADDQPFRERAADVAFAVPGSDGSTPVATSFAIGLAGGAAALLFEKYPGWTPSAVRGRLSLTADRVHPELAPYVNGRNDLYGSGRINLSRALETDFDGDGIIDADDPDADGDGLPDATDPCPLQADPACGGGASPRAGVAR